MTPSSKDLRILYQRSGNRCAYPGCGEVLTYAETEPDDPVVISQVAHIVAQTYDGPRGHYPLPPDERDRYSNLILLCQKHHKLVDDRVEEYTVERLHQMKAQHEALVQEATGRAIEARAPHTSDQPYVLETLHSTLLPVATMPQYVYGVACEYADFQQREVEEKIIAVPNQMWPFIIRNGRLFTFQNLNYKGGPFRNLVGDAEIERHLSRDWWRDPDHKPWFVSLLNRALNKLTGRKGLNLDKRHNRYYFLPELPGKPLEVTYRPLNQAKSTRNVVWQPITKATGEPKPYWYHLAVALQFHYVGTDNWCLSIRPEMHLTQDGQIPYDPGRVGRRVTRKKSRLFNYDLLGEVNFWRAYLSDGKPRIIFSFGRGQNLIVSTTLIQGDINWPGIPERHAKAFRNVEFEDDLFSLTELLSLEEVDDWEDDEEVFEVDEL